MIYFSLIIFGILFDNVIAMTSSKVLEGYPAGYLPDSTIVGLYPLTHILWDIDAETLMGGCLLNVMVTAYFFNDTSLNYLSLAKGAGPGSTIPTEIPSKDLKFLAISVQRKSLIFSVKPAYNYYEMKKLAKDPGADFSKPTVMFVGGYMDHPTYPLGTIIGSVYKKLGYTVLLLNMQKFTFTEYAIASRNSRAVGMHTAEMLANLTTYGLDPKRLSLVGISLGGQTISFIAKTFRRLTGMTIARITGLDPAGTVACFIIFFFSVVALGVALGIVLYIGRQRNILSYADIGFEIELPDFILNIENLGPEDRLDESDADFVDVVLTNIDGFGMAAPVGHVNFYVNGGEFQPGDVLWTPCNVLCSHVRSYTIWIAALHYPDRFIAMKCDSVQEARDRNCYDHTPLTTNVLGLNTDINNKGIFYLATVNNYPYFLGEKGLKRENEFFNMQVNLTRRQF